MSDTVVDTFVSWDGTLLVSADDAMKAVRSIKEGLKAENAELRTENKQLEETIREMERRLMQYQSNDPNFKPVGIIKRGE